MAEKHKTKYKSPKDLEKSTKPNTRKDIKDYTGEDAHGMVPNLTKGVQPLVLRKYATDVIDDVENMVPKIIDHIYKKVEEGEYSPEHARKVFEKLQLAGTEDYIKKLERIDHVTVTNSLTKPENEESLKESISKLSEDQKEQILRTYIRSKIAKVLRENYVFEQEDTEAAPEADIDVDTPEADTDTPEADTDTPEADVDIDTPEVDVDVDDTPDSDMSATTSFSGGGGSSSPSPSPATTTTPAADTTDTNASKSTTANEMKASIDSFVADIKSKLTNATPIEVAPDIVQPIKDLMAGMTAKKSKAFKKAIATAMRNADIKLPKPSPSDDYTEN